MMSENEQEKSICMTNRIHLTSEFFAFAFTFTSDRCKGDL